MFANTCLYAPPPHVSDHFKYVTQINWNLTYAAYVVQKEKDCSSEGTLTYSTFRIFSHALNGPKDFMSFLFGLRVLCFVFFKVDSQPCIETGDTVVLPQDLYHQTWYAFSHYCASKQYDVVTGV